MPKGTIQKRYGVKSLDCASTTIMEIANLSAKSKYANFKKIFSLCDSGCVSSLKIVKSNCLSPNFIIPIFLEYGIGIASYCYAIYYKKYKIRDFKEFSNNQLLKDKRIELEDYYLKENEIMNFFKGGGEEVK